MVASDGKDILETPADPQTPTLKIVGSVRMSRIEKPADPQTPTLRCPALKNLQTQQSRTLKSV